MPVPELDLGPPAAQRPPHSVGRGRASASAQPSAAGPASDRGLNPPPFLHGQPASAREVAAEDIEPVDLELVDPGAERRVGQRSEAAPVSVRAEAAPSPPADRSSRSVGPIGASAPQPAVRARRFFDHLPIEQLRIRYGPLALAAAVVFAGALLLKLIAVLLDLLGISATPASP